MIKGFFKYGFPMIELVIEDKKIELLLDTGFNGYLMLPKKMINKMNLEMMGLSDYTTASGEGKKTEIYKAKSKLFNEEIEISVLSTDGDFSLAGMELFHDCKIVLERHRDLVEITKTNVSISN